MKGLLDPDALLDTRHLDAEVARAHDAWSRAQSGDPSPLEGHRAVSGKRAYDALEVAASSPQGLVEVGLRRWIAELTLRRLGHEATRALDEAYRKNAEPLATDPARAVSSVEAWRLLTTLPPGVASTGPFAALGLLASAVASAARRRREVRVEVARRLGLPDGPWSLPGAAAPRSRTLLRGAAQAFLAATGDLARDVLREARHSLGLALGGASTVAEGAGPALALHVAAAPLAREGWPAHLTARWLEGAVPGFGGARVYPALRRLVLPAVLTPSSFLRGLERYGAAVGWGASGAMPFVLRHDPQPVRAHAYGALWATLPTLPTFALKAQGLSRGASVDQRRVLGRALLVAARLEATRFLLADEMELPEKDAFEEVTARAFGVPLPAPLLHAWPRPMDEGPARLEGLLLLPSLARELVQRFDDDWFKNPKAHAFLAARASAPARDQGPSGDDSPRELGRMLEELAT